MDIPVAAGSEKFMRSAANSGSRIVFKLLVIAAIFIGAILPTNVANAGAIFPSNIPALGLEEVVAAVKPATPKKSISITCTKGRISKKITGANPKCPSGFRKK